MITKFVLNASFHYVGMSWIISSNNEIKYKIDEGDHKDWLNKGPWYNTGICSRLHDSLTEDFITHARTDRYNLMCYLFANDKIQPAYEDDEISIGDRLITKHATTEALEELGDTLNFIYIWLQLLQENYEARRLVYITSIKEMFKQITQTMIKSFTAEQKV